MASRSRQPSVSTISLGDSHNWSMVRSSARPSHRRPGRRKASTWQESSRSTRSSSPSSLYQGLTSDDQRASGRMSGRNIGRSGISRDRSSALRHVAAGRDMSTSSKASMPLVSSWCRKSSYASITARSRSPARSSFHCSSASGTSGTVSRNRVIKRSCRNSRSAAVSILGRSFPETRPSASAHRRSAPCGVSIDISIPVSSFRQFAPQSCSISAPSSSSTIAHRCQFASSSFASASCHATLARASSISPTPSLLDDGSRSKAGSFTEMRSPRPIRADALPGKIRPAESAS